MKRHRPLYLFICLCLWLASHAQSLASDLQQENVTTTPAYADGVVYVASAETLGHRGHLRAIDILDTFPRVLWDAAEHVPPAGTSRTQPESVHPDNPCRTIFTNLDGAFHPWRLARRNACSRSWAVRRLPKRKSCCTRCAVGAAAHRNWSPGPPRTSNAFGESVVRHRS